MNGGEEQVCGFPKGAISKVMSKLEEKKINYLVLDPRCF